MFQGSWTCSKCGGEITQLPFEPKSDKGLTCRDCYFKDKNGGDSTTPTHDVSGAASDLAANATSDYDDRSDVPPFDPDEAGLADEPAPAPPDDLDGATPATPGERKMFQGDWSCAGCGSPITQLPFQPRDTSNLKCLDCFKASKA